MRASRLTGFLVLLVHSVLINEPCKASKAPANRVINTASESPTVADREDGVVTSTPSVVVDGEDIGNSMPTGSHYIHPVIRQDRNIPQYGDLSKKSANDEDGGFKKRIPRDIPASLSLSVERENVDLPNIEYYEIIRDRKLEKVEKQQQDAIKNDVDDADNDDNDDEIYENDILFEKNTYFTLKGKILPYHKNLFRCPPCNCSHSRKGNIQALCMKENLRWIPSTLPRNIISLDMSKNPIRRLFIGSLSQYPRLMSFNLTGVRTLVKISNASMPHAVSKLEKLDLRNNNISEVDDNSFQSMSSLVFLTLKGNSLRVIFNMTLSGLGHLQSLDLSQNAISRIDLGAFDHLHKLKTLNLSHNTRFSYSNHNMPPRLFMQLKQLKRLFIQGNSNGNRHYPTTALATLKDLRRLVIDGLHSPATLGPELKSLRNLVGLEFGSNGGVCFLENITETYFENVPHIKSLSLEQCSLKQVHPNAYKRIPSLTLLSLKHTKEAYDLYHAFEDLSGLQNSSLTSLTFNNLFVYSLACVSLKAEQARFLQHIQLQELDLSSNFIAVFQNDFAEKLPRTLRKLVLSNNAFTMKYSLLSHIYFLTKLVELDISNQNVDETYYPYYSTQRDMCPHHGNGQKSRIEDPFINSELSFREERHSDIITVHSASSQTIVAKNTRFKLPPNLKILKARSYTHFGLNLFMFNRKTKYSLREIDLARSFMSIWGSGHMMRSITKADLSQNYCSYISPTFFPGNNSLVQLQLSGNFLGQSFAYDEKGEIFQKLKLLYFLDISANVIYHLPQRFLSGLPNLLYLDISNNKLQALNVSFATNKHIRFIDASKNSISWVSRATRDTLDEIASEHKLNLDLTLNPLPCSCEGLEIIEWLTATEVTILNKDFLQCVVHGGHIEDIGNLQHRIQELQTACTSALLVTAVFAAAGSVFLTFLSLSLLYRYRWRLLYMRNVALARFLGNHKPSKPSSTFAYDAFIVHTETAQNLVLGELRQHLATRLGHKLCIPDVDFMPGSVIVTNIMAAVMNSRATVLVVTPDIGQDTWAEYSVKMALSEEHFRKRKSLFLLLVHQTEFPERQAESRGQGEDEEEDLLRVEPAMARDLLLVRQRGDFLELPPPRGHGVTGKVRENVWDCLSQHLGHTSDANERVYVDEP